MTLWKHFLIPFSYPSGFLMLLGPRPTHDPVWIELVFQTSIQSAEVYGMKTSL